MNKYTYLIWLVLITNNLLFSQWQLINPNSSAQKLNDILFTDNQTGYIVGNKGTILKTYDQGINWKGQNSHTSNNLYSVSFLDPENGVAVGLYGTIVKTENGGKDWQNISYNANVVLRSVYMKNEQDIWIVGGGIEIPGVGTSGNIILHSTDGGQQWDSLSISNRDRYYKITFVNNQVGWIIGGDGVNKNIILKTTDGGSSWVDTTVTNGAYFRSMHFYDDNIGWFIEHPYILKTQDGGNTWIVRERGNVRGRDITYYGYSNGWICGTRIFKTTDGGSLWEEKYDPPNNDWLYSIFFIDNNIGFSVGDNGNIVKSTDAGESWFNVSGNITINTLYSTCFTNESNAWAVGVNGTMLKTTDKGITWSDETIYTWFDLRSVFFIDELNGWAGGEGNILKTTDAGETWQGQPFTGWLNNLYFLDVNNGWASNFSYNWAHMNFTSDGGISWVVLNSGNNFHTIRDIHFRSLQEGIISTYHQDAIFQIFYGRIYKTIDGGNNWIVKTTINDLRLNQMSFVNQEIGFVVTSVGTMLKTTNYGENWTEIIVEPGNDLIDIHFADETTGWVVGKGGIIFYTEDGGINWSDQKLWNNHETLWSVDFTNDGSGIAVGSLGTILRFSDDSSGGNNNVIPMSTKLFQNYPNPFNPKTTLGFSIARTTFVYLTVFDVLGNKVETLVNKELTEGNYEATWNAHNFSSGIYFYQLQTESYLESKKMVLLK